MTTQITSATPTATTQRRKAVIRAACGAAVALAVAAGIGTWQLREHHRPAATVTRQQETGTANQTPGRGMVIAGTSYSSSAPVIQVPAYHVLVSSRAQAVAERDRLVQLNRLREANGERPLAAVVSVVDSDDEAAQIRRATVAVNAVRDSEGLARIEVIDQRSS